MPYQDQHSIPDEDIGAEHGGAASAAHLDDLLLGDNDNRPFQPMRHCAADGFVETKHLLNDPKAPEGDWRGEHLISCRALRQPTQTEADAERLDDARHVTIQALADGRWHRASDIADGTDHSSRTIAHILRRLAEEGICTRDRLTKINNGQTYQYQQVTGISA